CQPYRASTTRRPASSTSARGSGPSTSLSAAAGGHHFVRESTEMRSDRDFGFTDEQLMLRDAVRQFVRKEMPDSYARECDREKIAPLAVFDKMAGLGWLGVAIPEEYGGSGLGFV